MVYSCFDEVVKKARQRAVNVTIAVAAAADEHCLEAVLRAQDEGLVTPLLIGDARKIREIYRSLSRPAPDAATVFDCPDPVEACEQAVLLAREHKAGFLMKGAVDSKVYLKAVVNQDCGIGTGRLMSHFCVLEVPGYHKLVAIVDSGMIMYPTLNQKKEIILNTVETFRKLGYEQPKVAVLTCTEKANPKMPETIEAEELQMMNQRGEIPNCIVAGPLSYDCAMNRDIARIKDCENPVVGDPDILLTPDIHAGNILGKALTVSCGAKMAGFIVGAAVPVIMTSRGASAEEKFNSIMLAAAASAQ